MIKSYIKITPERLDQARTNQESLRAWFGFTDSSHKYCTIIQRVVYQSKHNHYILLDGQRVSVRYKGHNVYYVN